MSGRWPVRAGLAAALAVSAALLLYRIGDPISGYHAYNEAFYSDLAMRYLQHGFLAPWVSPLDVNNPPLYPFLVTTGFRLFGITPVVARMVSVISTLATLLLLFALGRRLYNERIGLLAAALFAVTPAVVLVGRNAQLDALAMALMFGAVLLYVEAVPKDAARPAAIGGVLLGLALLTKLPAVLFVSGLAVWESLRERGFRWVTSRRIRWFALPAALVASVWYVAQPLFNAKAYLAAQGGLASTLLMPDAKFLRSFVAEAGWGLSPVLALAALAAIVYMVVRRQPADLLVLSLIGAELAFYTFYHFHTYYLLPVMPLAAVAAARGMHAAGARSWGRAAAVAVPLVIVMLAASLVMLGVKKYSDWSLAAIDRDLSAYGSDPAASTVVVNPSVWDNVVGPQAAFYGAAIATDVRRGAEVLPAAAETDGRELFLLARTAQGGVSPRPLTRTVAAPVFFGYQVRPDKGLLSFFENGAWVVSRVGPPWRFGWAYSRDESGYSLYTLR